MPAVHQQARDIEYYYRESDMVHCSLWSDYRTECGVQMVRGALSNKRELVVTCLTCLVKTFR